MIVFPNCKINLGLHILQKRADGYHDLETVFYPVAMKDGLELIRHPDPAATEPALRITGSLTDSAPASNSCLKAWQLLRRDYPELPLVSMHLHKVIPSGAGLGGGSADAAFTLLLLNDKFQLGLSSQQLESYALELGSDCPFFISNQPSLAFGRGEVLKHLSLDLSSYRIAVIHPGIHISTPWAFSKIKPRKDRQPLQEVIKKPVTDWAASLVNDFEPVVFQEYPAIERIKEQLYASGAVYASLSGSGSSVFGLFNKEVSIEEASFPPGYFIRMV